MKILWASLSLSMAVGCGAARVGTSEGLDEDPGETGVGIFERTAIYRPCVSTQPMVGHFREIDGERSLLVHLPRGEEDDASLAVVRYRDTAPTTATMYECARQQAVETNAAPVRVRLARDESHAHTLLAELRRAPPR